MKQKQNLHLQKLKSGRSEAESVRIDDFFNVLDQKLDLPLYGKNLIFQHFIRAFEYYQDQGYDVNEICERMDPNHLGDFFASNQRRSYPLDNAAIIYPLGMKFGQMPMFRLSVELKEDIEPILLQLALDFTMKRFPTFSVVIKNGFFWHYLETTNHILQAEEEKDVPCKPISILLRSYRSLRVLYYKKRISVEFFHSITDGSGGMVFLKTLLGEYFRLQGKVFTYGCCVKDPDELPDEAELVNEFKNAQGKGDFSKFVDKKSIQLDGKLSKTGVTRIIHFIMDSDELKKVSRSYNGTVTAYLCAVLMLAAKKSIVRNDGIFNIQIPVNMRKFNHSATLRNYSMYFNATENLSQIEDKKELIEDIAAQIKEKGDETHMNQMMKITGKLIASLNYVPLFIKVPIVQTVYGYLSNSIIGCTLSNLGVIEMPQELQDEVDRFQFVLMPGIPNRVTSSMVTYGKKAVFTVIKNCHETVFEEEVYRLLKEDGLAIETEGSVEYES
ncbi:MAG: hypothetical protein II004_01795 [Erysipelotrichaceae bacterium]|nr:hypothetical protein [Erysipelotrichaceae bacterium]